jgi:hypothetical protein
MLVTQAVNALGYFIIAPSFRCCKSSVRVESELKGAVLLEQISLTVIPLDRLRIGHLPKYVLNYFILSLHFSKEFKVLCCLKVGTNENGSGCS